MTEIPGYSIQRILGRGGMATVYLAVQESLGREVALKVLVSSEARDPTAHERFLREARIAASLHHPHIVPIHDFGLHGDMAYIAMEYEPGGSIAPMPGERLGPREALKIIRDIAGALEYAHGRGVVHRDIKPDNLLRRDDGAAVLSDFGIARLIEGASVLTTEGTSVGTPQYMSPEQLRGEKVDGRSDLYSLGVVLWQLLTGELPYNGSDAWAIGTQHLSADIPRLPEGLTHLQPLLDSVLAKKPQARMQSGAELAQRAEALLSTVMTPETVASVSTHASGDPNQKPTQDRRAPAAPVRLGLKSRAYLIALGLGVLALALWFGWRQFDAHPATAAAPAQADAVTDANAASLGATGALGAPHVSIAVISPTDLSPGHDQAYLSDGIAEELQSRLSQVPGLEVAGRSSSRSFSGKDATVAQIGKALGVGNVLEGSVRKDADRLRITMRLSNVRTGLEIWSQTYDRKLTDVFAVQDDIAGAVVAALKLSLLEHGPRTGVRRHTPRYEVYEQYLRGRRAMVTGTPGALALALAAYQGAADKDPEFAEAWSGLAMALSFSSERAPPAQQVDLNTRALAAAERAVALDPGLGDAYATRGYLRSRRWDWDGALADTRKAVQLDPRDGRNQLRHALMLATLGRLPDARAQLEEGTRVDPLLLPLWDMLARVDTALGDTAAARAAVDQIMVIMPGSTLGNWHYGLLALLEGNATAARGYFDKVGDREGGLMAGYSLATTDAARAKARRELASRPGQDQYEMAVAHAWMGQKDEAFALLDAWVPTHDFNAQMMPFDTRLRGIMGDKRFAALLARMGLPARPK